MTNINERKAVAATSRMLIWSTTLLYLWATTIIIIILVLISNVVFFLFAVHLFLCLSLSLFPTFAHFFTFSLSLFFTFSSHFYLFSIPLPQPRTFLILLFIFLSMFSCFFSSCFIFPTSCCRRCCGFWFQTNPSFHILTMCSNILLFLLFTTFIFHLWLLLRLKLAKMWYVWLHFHTYSGAPNSSNEIEENCCRILAEC